MPITVVSETTLVVPIDGQQDTYYQEITVPSVVGGAGHVLVAAITFWSGLRSADGAVWKQGEGDAQNMLASVQAENGGDRIYSFYLDEPNAATNSLLRFEMNTDDTQRYDVAGIAIYVLELQGAETSAASLRGGNFDESNGRSLTVPSSQIGDFFVDGIHTWNAAAGTPGAGQTAIADSPLNPATSGMYMEASYKEATVADDGTSWGAGGSSGAFVLNAFIPAAAGGTAPTVLQGANKEVL